MLTKLMAFLLALFGVVSTPTTQPSPVPSPTPPPTPPAIIYIKDVPFTAQAPFGKWSDPRQQDGCEEASSLIAVSWARSQALTPQKSLDAILNISHFQSDKYSEFRDTSAADTTKRIIHDYFDYPESLVKNISSAPEIISELAQGNLIIAPMDGRKLGNPYFTPPGPERHMLVIRGYDSTKEQFITNDPGTRRGENYRYPRDVLFAAIRDYPTGYHIPITSVIKNIIVVSKAN